MGTTCCPETSAGLQLPGQGTSRTVLRDGHVPRCLRGGMSSSRWRPGLLWRSPDAQLTSADSLWDPGPSCGGHFAIPALEFLWGSCSPLCCSGISSRTWLLQGRLYCLFPSPSQDVGEPGRHGQVRVMGLCRAGCAGMSLLTCSR